MHQKSFIMHPARPFPREFEYEVILKGKPDSRLVRPCERYKEMNQLCTSVRSKIQQYYIYGETLDCSQHASNYQSCLDYRKSQNEDSLKPIIAWEKSLIETRKKTQEQNKVWEKREEPPSNFSAPLPAFIQKNHKESMFRFFEESE